MGQRGLVVDARLGRGRQRRPVSSGANTRRSRPDSSLWQSGTVIIIAGHLRVAASEREQYLTAVEDVTIRAREAPGCQDFVQSADPIDPERINIYERWDSDELLMSFRTSGDENDQPLPTPELLGAEVAKYRISAVESP